MNRKLVRAALAFGAATLVSGAYAADLPSRSTAPAPYVTPASPVFTWTGFYVGGFAGASFSSSNTPTFVPAGIAGAVNQTPTLSNSAGFTGGVEAGYNWQMNQFVFGLEGDLGYLGRSNANGVFNATGGGTYTLAGASRGNAAGSIRGRIGFAADRALFYVTGGLAFASGSAPSSIAIGGVTYTSNNNSSNSVGEVVGGGVEYAFSQNWTAKVEYLHNFMNNKNIVYTNGAGSYTTNGYKFDTNIIRVGLNYKF